MEIDHHNIESHNQKLIHCQKCERLVSWRNEISLRKTRAYRDWVYWGKPVPALGDLNAEVYVLGLAPGAHGSNRTGRMFTGDGSGDFLFPALFRAGFANQPTSISSQDGLILKNMYISAVCRCVPPGNKPLGKEIENCMPYAVAEMSMMPNLKVIVTLGSIAHNEIRRLYSRNKEQTIHPFRHNETTVLTHPALVIISSYHPSRQNTQTGRLTAAMFDQIWERVNHFLTGV